jgi:hypothetical protein
MFLTKINVIYVCVRNTAKNKANRDKHKQASSYIILNQTLSRSLITTGFGCACVQFKLKTTTIYLCILMSLYKQHISEL